MKVFVLSPREDWICDRLVNEWYENFPKESTRNEEKVSSENWYETQGVQPPPKGKTNDKNKKEDTT